MSDSSNWQRMRFKRNKVWLEMAASGKPLMRDGKVRIKYQLDQPHEYWVNPSNVTPLPDGEKSETASSSEPIAKTKNTRALKPAEDTPVAEDQCRDAICDQCRDAICDQCRDAICDQCRDAICIYTDGACSGNPGPAGIGIVMRYKDDTKEISRYIGQATNNVAELEAIRVGLAAVKNPKLPVIVFTDSSYALGLLSRGWKAKQNQSLVEAVRNMMGKFKQLRFVKVKGHAGHPDNERADRLAVKAIELKI